MASRKKLILKQKIVSVHKRAVHKEGNERRGTYGKFKWKIGFFREHVCSPWASGLTLSDKGA